MFVMCKHQFKFDYCYIIGIQIVLTLKSPQLNCLLTPAHVLVLVLRNLLLKAQQLAHAIPMLTLLFKLPLTRLLLQKQVLNIQQEQ